MWEWLKALEEVGLFIYSCFKACLPLPSLEVLLIPLCTLHPSRFVWYAVVGAVGTCVGGTIGYYLAKKVGEKILLQFATTEEMEHTRKTLEKYGVFAIFIGAITPIPDFLLAYFAGLLQMNLVPFLLADGIARLIRSLLVGYFVQSMSKVVDMERYGLVFSLFLVSYLIYQYLKTKIKNRSE